MDPLQLCRICAIDVANDTASHLLIENNQITELGEKFMECLEIQVKIVLLYNSLLVKKN